MKRIICLTLLTIFSIAAIPMESNACKCRQPDIARSYDFANDVAKIRIAGQLFFSRSGHKWYLGFVEESFKGCRDEDQLVIVETRSESAACGMYLQKDTYLLNGSDRSSFWGIPILGVDSCDYNRIWDTLSDKDLDYLYSRYNCCDGECSCTDGTQPVNCFVNPCMVSECGSSDATCSANYCGGCRAEWVDSTGALADCSQGCIYDGNPYQEGDKFPSTDGCNTCTCTKGGKVACTEMACFPTCDPAVEQSCEDLDLVCMADAIEETGMCQPFDHGTTVGAGYKCGGSIGVGCAKGLFCKGMPYNLIGGTGVCTLMECGDWSEEYHSLVNANNQCENPEDCQAISGTSCGCTRNLVLSKNADMDTFWNVTDLMTGDDCTPFVSICDCPAADGFKCENGHCAWNYTSSTF